MNDLRSKGEEGGKEWYKFLRGESVVQSGVDEIYVNGEVVKDKQKMCDEIASFWENIGGMNDMIEDRMVTINLSSQEVDWMNDEIGKDEIERYLKSLKNRKAS